MENIPSASAQLSSPPAPYAQADAQRLWQEWRMAADEREPPLAHWMREAEHNDFKPLLEGIFGNSPYLARLLLLNPDVPRDLAVLGIDAAYAHILRSLTPISPEEEQAELMRRLRLAK